MEEAYVDGVSTCSVDDLVKAMRMPRISDTGGRTGWRVKPRPADRPLRGRGER